MRNKDGFTLIEVAIVLVIGGILLATASSLLLIYIEQVQLKTTRQRMSAVNQSLQTFLNLNGRYPCPADMTAAPDTAGFGVEVSTTCGSLSGTASGTTETSGNTLPPNNFDVRAGAVPVRTLDLPDEFIADAWGQRFTYAVTERMANPGTYDRDEGAVDIVDTAGNFVVNPLRDPALGLAHYVVVSHGKNASGGTPVGGGNNPMPCIAGDDDEENCNGDSTFRRTLLFSTGANQMDDLISFSGSNSSLAGQEIPPRAVMAFNAHACPDGWTRFNDADGRVIVGMGTNGDGINYDLGDTATGAGNNEEGVSRPLLDEEQVRVSFTSSGINLSLLPSGSTYLAVRSASHDTHENRMPFISLIYCEKSP